MRRYSTPTKFMCLLACLAALPLAGCRESTGLQKVIVSGSVKYDGQPISNGEIRFFPIEGTQGPVSGSPIVNGTYEAKYRDGVPVGKHRVEIMAYRSQKGSVPEEIAREGGPTEQYLPARFNTDSELTRSVEASTKSLDFDLSSKKKKK